jgi:hypothetical protein
LAAAQYSGLRDQIHGMSEAQVRKVVAASPVAKDHDIAAALHAPEGDSAVRSIIEMRAATENASIRQDASRRAAAIKSSPLYRDAGVEESSNWLGRALMRLKNIHFNLPTPSGPAPGFLSFLGPVFYYLMWFLIALAIAFLVFLAVKHIRWQRRLKRRVSAMLEDDEPDRTLDEWLAQADALEAEGKHREAVRALYLACLLKFDEALVARFDRSETNWEHLRRIEASPKLPVGLDFRAPTGQFDRIWYGHIVRGPEDVSDFRGRYVEVTEALKRRAA